MTEDFEVDNQGLAQEEPMADAAVNDEQAPVFNKKQVSDVVRREQQKAYEKGKKEALMQMQQEQQAQQAQAAQAPPSQLGGMAQMSPDEIRQMIADQAPQVFQEHVQQMQTAQTVDSFVQKMQAAEQRHPGLESKLNDLDWNTLAPLVQLANSMENTGDIMAELIEHPNKMGNLLTLMNSQPKLAARAMHDLSNSIRQNQDALAEDQSTREPLGQIKPSKPAGMDSGSMSVKDFKRMFRG